MRRLTWLLLVSALASGMVLMTPVCRGGDPPEPSASVKPGAGKDTEKEATTPLAEKPANAQPPAQPPINILLKTPAELGDFLKSLDRPDFILMSGEELKARIEHARETAKAAAPGSVVVRSVAVRGEVVGDLAEITLQVEADAEGTGPSWVSLRLDNQTVTEAREGDRLLPLRVAPGGGWQVELTGAGPHKVLVALKVRLRSSTEGRHLELAIPEAAATEVELNVDQELRDASASLTEPLELTPIRGGKATKVAAHLSPRSRFEVSWRVASDPSAQLPPLLTIQGEIAIDIDPGSFRTRSSWVIRSVRGASRSLEFRLDPDDEVLELSLDGQPVPAGLEKIEGGIRLTIQLTEPLRPGTAKRLVMATRRPLSLQSSARITFSGFSLANAKEQTGAIGIAQGGNLFISGTTGRGLRQIDPRTGLPDDLRTRPSTVLAYQFVDQPFELSLRIDSSPPLVRTDARTNIRLDARQAHIDTWLRSEAANGRLFDLHVLLPRGLELESVGPKSMIESSQVIPDADGSRLLTVRLASRPPEGSAFEIHLTGRQILDPSRGVEVALFQPRESASGGGRIAVTAERNLTVDLLEEEISSTLLPVFRPSRDDLPLDWPAPSGEPLRAAPSLWLNYDGTPPSLPLRVTVHPRAVSISTSLFLDVTRRGTETRQETECSVQFGTLDHLDVEVPRSLVKRWEIESDELASPIDLGPTASGGRLVRLKFAELVTDKILLVFRLRQPWPLALAADKPTDVLVDWIRCRTGSASVRVNAAAEMGIRLEPRSIDWVRADDDDSAEEGPGTVPRLTLTGEDVDAMKEPLVLSASAFALTSLPTVVAPHLWLRTVQGPANELRTTARYLVETQATTIAIALPVDSELIQARANGEPIVQIERLSQASSLRFHLPERSGTGPISLELQYASPRPEGSSASWVPPRLLEGGVVQQTFWEVRVPSSHALVGVPSGWTDENRWYWDLYVWKRRPWLPAATLAAWVGAASSNPKQAEDWVDEGREGYHNYLFSRLGAPTGFSPAVAYRPGLVALWSGLTLGVGVFILYLRPWLRGLALILLALVLSIAISLQPSTTILAVQSAFLGVAFTLLSALVKRHVERPRPMATAVFGDPASPTSSQLPGSSVSRPTGVVGSDDSTAIRVRPASTVDHLPVGTSLGLETGSGRTGTRGEG